VGCPWRAVTSTQKSRESPCSSATGSPSHGLGFGHITQDYRGSVENASGGRYVTLAFISASREYYGGRQLHG
jgi:hypothetical protein